MKPEFRLIEEVLSHSVETKDWDIAKQEWDFNDSYINESGQTCLCGHKPIHEICIIVNNTNGKALEIGNVCVTKFMEIPIAERIFNSFKKLKKNIGARMNIETLYWLHENKIMSQKDFVFYMDTKKKIKLTWKQMKWRKDINTKFINRIKRHERTI